MLLWVSTLTVSQPSMTAETPRRPWEAITINVASSLSRRIDNRLVGVLVFNLHHIARHAGRRGSILRRLEIFRGNSGNTFFVLVRRVRHHARLNRENMERLRYGYCGDFGIEAFASPIPWSTAFFDSSDPSVGIRICLYICTSLKFPECAEPHNRRSSP
jgi:hypothetical protein